MHELYERFACSDSKLHCVSGPQVRLTPWRPCSSLNCMKTVCLKDTVGELPEKEKQEKKENKDARGSAQQCRAGR